MMNTSAVTEFVLLGFPFLHPIRSLCFLVVLVTYSLCVLGNGFILTIVLIDQKLQTPMYGFLCNLAFLEICYTSIIVPKLLQTFVSTRTTICYRCCMAQIFFIFSFGAIQLLILTVMAFDRYIAICKPLHYPVIMTKKVCIQLATGCWLVGFAYNFFEAVQLWTLPFCDSNVVDHYLCDIGPVLSLSCADARLLEFLGLLSAVSIVIITFSLIVVSYIFIISTILRIPSSTGRKKAFSTCTSHLAVVSILYGAIAFMYIRPNVRSSFHLSKVVAVLNTVVAPMLNPFIYTIRNVEVKQAFWRAVCKTGGPLKRSFLGSMDDKEVLE
ncbi:olfactory receptor 6X1-like [Eublepharis macularius]|uniref:Olfactory receptor 6X1-like n=1 Tax=Eublepharis macularius TaxID=481883 RepID=A0AA97LC86_EUBMA|nr:olfactory receptor 6X1-like [Eublepharis macularius]